MSITFAGDRLRVEFRDFGPEEYPLFLACKRLPESVVTFDPEAETYSIDAPARFADMLGVEPPSRVRPPLPLADHLFDSEEES